jgi:hypothetical protein
MLPFVIDKSQRNNERISNIQYDNFQSGAFIPLESPKSKKGKKKRKKKMTPRQLRRNDWIQPEPDEGDVDVILEYLERQKTLLEHVDGENALDQVIGDLERLDAIYRKDSDESDGFPQITHFGWEGVDGHLFTDSDDSNDSEDVNVLKTITGEQKTRGEKKTNERRQFKQTKREKMKQLEAETDRITSLLAQGGFGITRPTFQQESLALILRKILDPIHESIRNFVNAAHSQEPLAPMPAMPRRLAGEVCKVYGVKLRVRGKGAKAKFPIMIRTQNTRMPNFEPGECESLVARIVSDGSVDISDVQQLIMKPPSEMRNTQPKKQRTRETARQATKREKTAQREESKREKASAANHAIGSLVGHNSQPVGEDNLGHRMLVKLGWQGGGLGSEGQGIAEPISVVVRGIRRGLGN